jgi:uncharacterized membrane protein YccC
MDAAGHSPHTSHFLRDSSVFEWKNFSLLSDLKYMVAIAICLAVGLYLGHPAAGMIAAGGAMTVGLGARENIDYSSRLSMIFVSLGMAFSTFIGMVSGHTNVVLVAVVALWGFGYGMLSTREGSFGWVGQQSCVFLLVASAFPSSARDALVRASLVLAGGAVQTFCTSVLSQKLEELQADLMLLGRYVREEKTLLRSTMVDLAQSLRSRRVAHEALPFAVRLAVTLAVSTEIYRRLNFQTGYWIPMTALLVLKPGLTDTASRAIARTAGTLAGAVMASFFIAHLPLSPAVLALFTVVFAWLAYASLNVNYALFSVMLTGYIVFLLSLNRVPGSFNRGAERALYGHRRRSGADG